MSHWKTTNYHKHVQSTNEINFINGCWYEIGFQNQFNKDFVHQGIKQYNDGFLDDYSYPLKSFPTHAKEIKLTIPEGQFTY